MDAINASRVHRCIVASAIGSFSSDASLRTHVSRFSSSTLSSLALVITSFLQQQPTAVLSLAATDAPYVLSDSRPRDRLGSRRYRSVRVAAARPRLHALRDLAAFQRLRLRRRSGSQALPASRSSYSTSILNSNQQRRTMRCSELLRRVTACCSRRRPAPAAFPHRLRRPPQSLSLGSFGDFARAPRIDSLSNCACDVPHGRRPAFGVLAAIAAILLGICTTVLDRAYSVAAAGSFFASVLAQRCTQSLASPMLQSRSSLTRLSALPSAILSSLFGSALRRLPGSSTRISRATPDPTNVAEPCAAANCSGRHSLCSRPQTRPRHLSAQAAPPSAVAELGVVRRRYARPVNERRSSHRDLAANMMRYQRFSAAASLPHQHPQFRGRAAPYLSSCRSFGVFDRVCAGIVSEQSGIAIA